MIKNWLAILLLGVTLVSCGDDTGDADDVDSTTTEMGLGNENDSYRDTGVLVKDPNNNLNADPINDTTVKPEAVH